MKPVNRKEMFLDAMAKGDFSGVEPVTREEMFMQKVAENGNTGGTTTVTIKETAPSVYSLEGEFAELKQAFDNGKFPEIVFADVDGQYWRSILALPFDTAITAHFHNPTTTVTKSYVINSDNSVSEWEIG